MKVTKKVLFITLLIAVPLIILSYNYIDKDVALYFLAHQESYKYFGKLLSISGESQWYIGAGILGFLYYKYIKKDELIKNRFLFLFYANVFSGLLSIVLKWIFGRIRPKGLQHGHDEYGFLLFQNFDMGFVEKMKYHFTTMFHHPSTYASFPSGHTVTIAATFTVLYLLFPRYVYLWIIFALSFASGRILAGDHFVSDIMAGSIVGVFSTLYIYQKMRDKIEKKV